MENKHLTEIWSTQSTILPSPSSQNIIKKAVVQRRNQKIGMVVMSTTVGILIPYTIWQFPEEVNWFAAGLLIMIVSLLVRIIIEYYSKLSKVSKLMTMDGKHYLRYLQTYYKRRKQIHFIITPVCFGGYLFGLWHLFPYFKTEFSNGFYIYLIVSGSLSLLVIAIIIIVQIRKELRFLNELKSSDVEYQSINS